jgi:DNA-binding NarL/FixJ family response regulator
MEGRLRMAVLRLLTGMQRGRMFDLKHRQYIRILIIEEEGLVRAALVALVTNWEGFHVVAEAATKVETLEQFRHADPDVVLLSLAGPEDATLVPEISRACGRTRLLVLLSHCPEDLRLVITGLAKRVVAKTEHPDQLKRAIEEIYGEGRTRRR